MRAERSFDVVVIGGGAAGVMAACAAAKAGCSVLLAESGVCLGGVVTQGPLEALMTQFDSSRKVIGGLADELIAALTAADSAAKNVRDTTGYCSFIIPYQPEQLKLQLLRMLERYHVAYMLEATLSSAQVEGGSVQAICLQTKAGAVCVRGKAFVDCSGSGILGYCAGNDVMLGDDDGVCQPVTVLSRWGGVDIPKLREYARSRREDFKVFGGETAEGAERLHLWGFKTALREGYESGALRLFREEMHLMESTVPGEVVVNYSRVTADPWDAFSLSAAQYECSEQVYELYSWFKKTIPAFAAAEIIQSGYPGVRESGRVKGRRILSREDIVSGTDDGTSVAMGAFPIDIHRGDSGMRYERILKAYCIPADALAAESVRNLFMGGRCISSTFEANGSCRISLTCMATGQASGAMAAVCALNGGWTAAEAREVLVKQGAIIH